MTDQPPALVSTAEAARAAGVSTETLARWAREGRVKAKVTNRGAQRTTYRWDLDDLLRQLADDQD